MNPDGERAPRAEFTLLLPVYAGNSMEQLRAAFVSSVAEQTRRPDAVLITVDGPVPAELDAVLLELVETSPVPARLVRLPENHGLAAALNAGLAEVTTEYAARMDADDLSRPERFARQLGVIEAEGLDILGTGLDEFVGEPPRIVATRVPPIGAKEVRHALAWQQPFHHPTVVYRVSSVLAVGGYPVGGGRLEDYALFARMIAAGAHGDNLPDSLVLYRADEGAYDRRGGWQMFRDELRLQRELRDAGLTGRVQFVRNVVLRGGYRLTPTFIRSRAYRGLATRRA